MIILKFWNYLRGYVYIKLEGLNLERVINLAISRNILLWDIKRINYTTIEAKVGAKCFNEMEEILRKTGCEGKIYLKVGWPFFVAKIQKRKSIVIGLFICMILLITVTSFIWTIDINCDNYILEKDILIHLNNKVGLNKGVFKYKINIPEIENELLIHYDRIAWVDIDIRGTKVTVNIVEKKLKPKLIKDTTPCDIVAKKMGIIEKVIPRQGDAMVKKGDVVKPNQVLISGTIKRNEEVLQYVHSDGEVYATTYYKETDNLWMIKTIKEKTGNTYTRTILKVGNTSITIGSNNIPFNKYIIETKNKTFKWRNIRIPVEIVYEEYCEIKEKKVNIPESDIKKAMREKLMVKLIPRIPVEAKIHNKTIVYSKEENLIIGELTIEVSEPIGKQRIIIPPLNEAEDQELNN